MVARQDGVWIAKPSNNMKGAVASPRPLCKFYLVNPRRDASVNSAVRKLIGISEVDEVYVTEGPHGFLVKASPSSAVSSRRITSSIARQFSGNVGVITGYARYRK
jgi:hypothetical protein